VRSSAFALIVGMAAALPAHSATEAEVGDPDSFRRNVTYLGLAQTAGVRLHTTCAPDPEFPPSPGDRCRILEPQPTMTTFNESSLDSVVLPANASRSLLCHTLSPIASLSYLNATSDTVAAQVSTSAVITIQNEILNDPSLLDPRTGRPFGGRLTRNLATLFDEQQLVAGQRHLATLRTPRECEAGLISKRMLVNTFGLSEAQATAFFTKRMTLTFGMSGNASGIKEGQFTYTMRLYGDN
jgi:hypothetical protein